MSITQRSKQIGHPWGRWVAEQVSEKETDGQSVRETEIESEQV